MKVLIYIAVMMFVGLKVTQSLGHAVENMQKKQMNSIERVLANLEE